jgi:hypothetical protein
VTVPSGDRRCSFPLFFAGASPDNPNMRICELLCASTMLAFVLSAVQPVSAQTFESVGVRAQGLGGAFVAVADDATASWWNPAGLATGAYLSAVVERGRTTEPENPSPAGPGLRTTSGDFAVAFPALGLSYYRLRISEIAGTGSTAAGTADRQDPAEVGSSVRSVALSQFGTTIGQSIGEHLVIGSTVKLLRAGAVSGSVAADDPLDAADDLDVDSTTRVDLDLGAMANFGHVRVGLAVRNITEPEFGDGIDRLALERQARMGVAVLSVPNGAFQGVTASADADLTTTTTAVGDVRHVAGGVEGWLANGRLGLRAGVSANTVGEARPAGSAGVSVALTRGLRVNASRTQGRDKSVTGWSSSVSLTF